MDRIACRGLVPDLTLLIDIDVETGLGRAHRRNQRTQDVETRMDEQPTAFHQQVRAAYRHLAEEEPARVKLIDGTHSEAQVAGDLWDAVSLALEQTR